MAGLEYSNNVIAYNIYFRATPPIIGGDLQTSHARPTV